MKILVIALSFLIILTACNRQTSPTDESTQVSTTHSTSEPAISESSTSEELTVYPANIVGTWKQENLTLTVDSDGNWQFSGNIISQGTLQVAAATNDMKLLKFYGFDTEIDNIGNYFIARFNESSTSLNLGYLGNFLREGDTEQELSDLTYMDVVEGEIDFSQSIIGTWINENPDYHYQSVWNYNPDGTFEIYSDGKGEASFGIYRVESLDEHRINLYTTYEDNEEEHVSEYTLENGKLTPTDFEWQVLIRNTDPTTPE